jgi:polyhydroxyalkanoate synthase
MTTNSAENISVSTANNDEPKHQICYLDGNRQEIHPVDMAVQNYVAKLTGGISPASINLAWMDWMTHLAASPGKQIELTKLIKQRLKEWPELLRSTSAPGSETNSKDNRFAHAGWSQWPFNAMSQSFLDVQDFWQQATTGVRGVSEHHENVVNFMSRQLLDMVCPSNIPYCNPEVIEATINQGGKNLVSGMLHWMQDMGLELPAQHAEDELHHKNTYQPGHDVALSQGKVVFKNHLIELIQYTPLTSKVYAEPILIIPSWIMKYYILDLSPHNSMVRFLLEQGHTVFMISWKNPDKDDRDLGMDDYLELGLFAALSEVSQITHKKSIHTCGYCLGGTLLAIGAAALYGQAALRNQVGAHIASVSLLAAQTDFSEPGELGLFIDESQLAMLDALMWKQGYLDGKQMAGSFQILNSRDLIWSKIMRDYQLGLRTEPNDLMSWNADTTRMPYRMHSEYLKHLFLHNDLAKGHYEVHGHAIALKDIKAPMFVVGTAKDHVSPWKSVYKIHVLTDTEIEFVLASGGHNAGIVSEPGHPRRSYQCLPEKNGHCNYNDPEDWLKESKTEPGSWWIHWEQWLVRHSAATQVKALQPKEQAALGNAPGTYIFEK